MDFADDALLQKIVVELSTKYRCHTILLYGSRARGDATEQSDYDLLGVCKTSKACRIAEIRKGYYLDIFIQPEKNLKKVGENHLYMKDAIVLFEKNNFGTNFIKKLKLAKKMRYQALPNDEIQARRIWLHKMLERIAKGDIEANYRRSCLQTALLYEYFNIRKIRYEGSKQSFGWLKKNDPKVYQLFDQVLKKPMNLNLLKKLVEKVSQIKYRQKGSIPGFW